MHSTKILVAGHFDIRTRGFAGLCVLVLSDAAALDATAQLFIGGQRLGDPFEKQETTFEVFGASSDDAGYPQLVDTAGRGALRFYPDKNYDWVPRLGQASRGHKLRRVSHSFMVAEMRGGKMRLEPIY